MRTESQTFLFPSFFPTPLEKKKRRKKKKTFHSLQSHGYLTGCLSPLTPEAWVTVGSAAATWTRRRSTITLHIRWQKIQVQWEVSTSVALQPHMKKEGCKTRLLAGVDSDSVSPTLLVLQIQGGLVQIHCGPRTSLAKFAFLFHFTPLHVIFYHTNIFGHISPPYCHSTRLHRRTFWGCFPWLSLLQDKCRMRSDNKLCIKKMSVSTKYQLDFSCM